MVRGLPRVDLFLTRAEASDLRDALYAMLQGAAAVGWHEHVMSDDGQTEISIAWESDS